MMTRNVGRDMYDYIPRFFSDSRIVSSILDPETGEVVDLDDSIIEVLDQFFTDTITVSIDRWEKMCGITPDPLKPIDQRRSLIKSRIRGTGTVTVDMIKSVAESFDNGEVSVQELPATYEIKITFVANRGIPPNLTDTQNALRDILPAHLGVTFIFTYLTWNELDSYVWTWNVLDGKALTWNAFETYKP